MSEYSLGDRVLVPGKISGFNSDGEYDVTYASGKQEWHYPTDLRPDTGGRDLTAQDVQDSQETWTGGTAADYRQYTAEYLNRIARGDAGSAGDDAAPDSELCHAAASNGHGCPGQIVNGQCTEQDDHHGTAGMVPCCGPGEHDDPIRHPGYSKPLCMICACGGWEGYQDMARRGRLFPRSKSATRAALAPVACIGQEETHRDPSR